MSVHGQDVTSYNLQFRLLFNQEVFLTGKQYLLKNGTGIKVQRFRLYVSGFSFYNNAKKVYTDIKSNYLLDAANPESLLRTVNLPQNVVFNEVKFYFGVTPEINDQGVGEGDLDPANDMYWTWHTGYINLKAEGVFGLDNKAYQYHLGGFSAPYVSSKLVSLKIESKKELVIALELGKFFNTINMITTPVLMSPGEKSADFSVIASKMFFVP